MIAEPARVDTGLDVKISRAFGRDQVPAVSHFSSVDDAMQALSSLLVEIIGDARGHDHTAKTDLTIEYTHGALHVSATCLSARARPLALTLMLIPLSAAEQRVLGYLPTNLTFAAIAEEGCVSRNTVKTQAISIYRKLGVSTRHDAVLVARELGLLSDAG